MKQEMAYNLFSNFQSTIFRAIKAFLHKNNEDGTEKTITTTLRITTAIKNFYECIADAEMTSINTAIVNTLSKVKDQTINEYQQLYTKINDTYDYQINSFLKIIDNQKIDYNDLCTLLEWTTGNKISRSDITDKEKLINIFDKNAQLKLSKIFGYNYQWLQDNTWSTSYQWDLSQNRWYKNVQSFIRELIVNFYLDETVESFELSFLCCDRNVVNNIISKIDPKIEEYITPIVIANRSINGIKTNTYHKFESNDINYDKCRSHFVVLIKMALMLSRHGIIKYPNSYWVTPQQHDRILDGSLHLAELFKNRNFSNSFNLDDLENITPYSLAPNETHKTSTPNIYHSLNWSVIDNIMIWSDENSSSIVLTDELASKCAMNKKALAKYLRLFDTNLIDSKKNSILTRAKNEDAWVINLDRIRELRLELKNLKMLDTSFG